MYKHTKRTCSVSLSELYMVDDHFSKVLLLSLSSFRISFRFMFAVFLQWFSEMGNFSFYSDYSSAMNYAF